MDFLDRARKQAAEKMREAAEKIERLRKENPEADRMATAAADATARSKEWLSRTWQEGAERLERLKKEQSESRICRR